VPLLTLVAEISADLAIVNLLPIPALDGGRLLFVLISLVTRRRLRPEVEGMAHALGMAALLTLIFVVSWHDVMNLINNKPVF
jgi:regulator of sigma E protease